MTETDITIIAKELVAALMAFFAYPSGGTCGTHLLAFALGAMWMAPRVAGGTKRLFQKIKHRELS